MEELGLELEDYSQALCDLYGKERVVKALNILNGEALLVNTELHEDYRNMLQMYDRLEVKKQAGL